MSKSFLLGRADAGRADILLSGNTISAKHAELHIDHNGKLLVRDLGSSNGTSIIRKGKLINVSSQSVPLASTDILSLGGKNFSIEKLLKMLPKDGNAYDQSKLNLQADLTGKMMRCLACGSVTPLGSSCVECGYHG